jgi:membrane-bound lytic murein transglycosylase D
LNILFKYNKICSIFQVSLLMLLFISVSSIELIAQVKAKTKQVVKKEIAKISKPVQKKKNPTKITSNKDAVAKTSTTTSKMEGNSKIKLETEAALIANNSVKSNKLDNVKKQEAKPSYVDTVFKYKKEIAKTNTAPTIKSNTKEFNFAENKITPVGPENSKIVKKKPTFNSNSSKSAQDPNSLNLSGFKVSPNLYGDYAPIIFDYVKNYHGNFGNYLGRIQKNNKSRFVMIDNAMRKAGLPKEFRSLAIIESGLNPNAVSPVGAVGPWQFMEPTAEMLGLRVDETVDERRDFQKSTLAAAKFCKRLHNMFHDWLLVVASYNCGPSPVLRHLQRTGGSSFWDIKQFLPKETQNHVMAFIATSAYYDKNTKVLDLGGVPKAAALAYAKTKAAELKNKDIARAKISTKQKTTKKTEDDESDMAIAEVEEVKAFDPNAPLFLDGELSQIVMLKVKGAYNLESISEIIDYDITRLRRWNPNFNKLAALNTEMVKLVLPSESLESFLIQKAKILQYSLKNPKENTNNENVAAKYKVPKVIKSKPAIAKMDSSIKSSTAIAKKSPESTDNIKKIPSVESKTNTTNQNVVNISKNKETSTSVNKKKYIIKNGDQLNQIAETFGITVARLCELNKTETLVLKPGHTLYLE